MKRTLYLLFLVLFGLSAYSINWVNIRSANPAPAKASLVSSNVQTSVVKFTLDGFSMMQVATPHGKAYVVLVDGAMPILSKGNPELPKITASVIIPDLAEMEMTITASNYKDYNNIDIAPSKGNFTRDIEPSAVPFVYGKSYSTNADYPGKLSVVRDPYIIRDYRGQTIIAYPFQYNPVTKTLRVYYEITVSLVAKNNTGKNPLVARKSENRVDREFKEIYSKQFLNYNTAKYTPLEEQGNMLVICYGAFMPAMQPFVDWKNRCGIKTTMVDVATIGNSAAIASYVAAYYNDPGLTYLLLVGDNAQVPTFMASTGASDNSYGFLVGNDHYPDIFVGRFSAESLDQVVTQVQKTMTYEMNPVAGNWLKSGIGIGSDQGPGDDNEYDYQHIRNLRTQMMNYTYTTYAELYDGSQGGQDLTGNPTPAMVAAAINEGAGVITYCGHGSQTSWGTSGFSNTEIASLTNYGMLPFIFSVACVNGDFTSGTCFAEGWLRAKYNNQLTGAVATLMSTINQSWNPPMEGEDEMIAILVESYSNNIKRTFGGISMNGCMKMNDTYGSAGNDMTDTWTVFGDPSLMVRTNTPQTMTVTHAPTIFIGATQFQVNCNVEGALVTISLNNVILGTAKVQGGVVNISFPGPLTSIDTLDVYATAYNYLPYTGIVPIIAATGPYVCMNSYILHDNTGNNNGQPDFGENINLDMTLKNLGISNASNVNATLSTTDPAITFTDNSQGYGNIASNASSTQPNAYAFSIANNVPDNHPVPFHLAISDAGSNNWSADFSMMVHAPALEVGDITVDDASGNNNGTLDPGETVNILINTINSGHCPAPGTLGTLSSPGGVITINNVTCNFNTLANGTSANAIFNVSVDASATNGMNIPFTYSVASGAYTATSYFVLHIGLVSEDYETGDFLKFNWVLGGDVPWVITSLNPHAGLYCAKSGVISDNQTSTMQVTFNVITNDSISFWRKVGSEQDYDFLTFYIDGDIIDQWSGSVGWGKVGYPAGTGVHTFKWVYSKDVSQATSPDCAWVDDIIFPPVSMTATSISEPSKIQEADFNVYPNPASSKAMIEYQLPAAKDVVIVLYDLLGNKVRFIDQGVTLQAGKHKTAIDISDLPSGFYTIKLQSSDFQQVKKLIIKR